MAGGGSEPLGGVARDASGKPGLREPHASHVTRTRWALNRGGKRPARKVWAWVCIVHHLCAATARGIRLAKSGPHLRSGIARFPHDLTRPLRLCGARAARRLRSPIAHGAKCGRGSVLFTTYAIVPGGLGWGTRGPGPVGLRGGGPRARLDPQVGGFSPLAVRPSRDPSLPKEEKDESDPRGLAGWGAKSRKEYWCPRDLPLITTNND
jgi:hypothetical protein